MVYYGLKTHHFFRLSCTINRFQFVELLSWLLQKPFMAKRDTKQITYIKLCVLLDFSFALLRNGSVWNRNDLILFLKRIQNGSLSWHLLLQCSKINFGQICRKLIYSGKQYIVKKVLIMYKNLLWGIESVLSFQAIQLGLMLRNKSLGQLLPIHWRSRHSLKCLRHLPKTRQKIKTSVVSKLY